MTTTQEAIAAPERLQGQGLDPEQYESGDRAIHVLLTDATAGPQTDIVDHVPRRRVRGLGARAA